MKVSSWWREPLSIVYYFSPLVLLVGADEHNQTDLAVLGENRNYSQAPEIIGKLYIQKGQEEGK